MHFLLARRVIESRSSVMFDRMLFVKNASGFAVACGLFTFVFYAIMVIRAGDNPKPATYPNAHGFETAIAWFELAATPEEVFQILGNPETDGGRKIRETMDTTNRWDFPFIIGYSAFNASLFFLLRAGNNARSRRIFKSRGVAWIGIVLGALMIVGDYVENFQLLTLTGLPNVDSVASSTMVLLNIFTRIKWASIFFAGLLLGWGYSSYFGRSWGLGLSFLFTMTAFLGVFSISVPGGRHWLEPAALLIGAAWAISLVHAVVVWRKAAA